MEIIKENDFVELDYTGRAADNGEVFDTTSAEIARQAGIFDERMAYEAAIVCIGKKHLLAGLDRQLVGKETGKDYTFKVTADEGFGRKNGKLIQLVSTAKFRQQNMTPFPGMQVNIDGIVGTVKTVTGGRTIVDFNHPLSGRDLEYSVFVKRIVADLSEKVKAVLRLVGISPNSVGISVSEGNVSIEFPQEAPEELKKDLGEKLKSTITELKSVSFTVKAAAKDESKEQKADVAAAAANGVETQQQRVP
ncbi:peptidylprolyl isomerase [Candidatus Woesearchaeota archaeon]|nr:peptidylprolyl isomerase [Candidatus Woesearchaeota archaeon]